MGTETSAAAPAGGDALLDVRGLTKIFGSLTACDHIDLTVGNLNVTPGFGGNIGLVGLTGHVGF